MAKKLLVLTSCLIAVFGFACGSDDAERQAGGGTPSTASKDDGSNEAAAAPASVEVTTDNFTFKPSEFSVAAGGTIDLVMKTTRSTA